MNDLRFAFRQLLKNPGFTAVAVLTLALGMGVNVSIFSIFSAAIWRSLPGVEAPHEVVYATDPVRVLYPRYEFFRDNSQSFSGLVASGGTRFRLDTIEPAMSDAARERVLVRVVAGDYFGVLGAEPPLGRYFLPAEYGEANGAPVIVLSHRFWREHFQADASVLGQTIRLEDEAFTIVGVAPEGFPGREPSFNFMEPSRSGVDDAPDAWSPLRSRSSRLMLDRGAHDLRLIGRLKKGVSREQAEMELSILAAQWAESVGEKQTERPDAHRVHLVAGFTRIPPLSGHNWREASFISILLHLVLVVACANITNLLLARAADRQREIGIRQALGASRGRLVRQFLSESILLALLGGAAGILLSHWCMTFIRSFGADRLPEYRGYIEGLDFAVDWRVVAYVFGLSIVSGIVFGLAPALNLSRANLPPALKQEGSLIGMRLRHSSLRNLLVIGQVAIALCLTIAAGLLARSAQLASHREFGFASREVLLVELALPGYSPDRARAFHREIMERLSALPGVEAVGLTSIPKGGERVSEISVDGGTPQPLNLGFAGVNRFSPGYLEALKISLLHGRDFTEEDVRNEAPVALVSESMAQRYWPNQNALGGQFSLGRRGPVFEVIGITRDTLPANLRNTMPGGRASWFYSAFAGDLYLPLRLNAPDTPALSLVVQVAGNPKALMPLVTKEIHSMDRNAIASSQTIRDLMDAGLAPFVAGGLAASSLGLLASTLAMMGIYGVMAHVVRRRTHEVGVRMALGAQRADVLGMVIGQGMRVVAVGVVLGVAGACGFARYLASKLMGLSPLDPVSFIGISFLSLLAALLACYLPARGAAKVDPVVALRYE